ncbi:MAG: hypothetical protein LUQ65_01930 [Candidatus Helarchaeota archaeon]|nr:hypothetical protein [Candidatus Helarchaeota archaeon]
MSEKSDESIKSKALEILLNKYKDENENLNAQIESLKRYKNRTIGYILIFASTLILLLSVFLIKDLQFIFLGIAAIALISLAIYLIFIYTPRSYPLKVLNSALQLTTNNLIQLLSHFQLENNAIFLPTEQTVHQFIPFMSGASKNGFPLLKELYNGVFEIENKGLIIHPIGFSIFELVKKEFNLDRNKIKSENLELLLQEMLINQLNLVKTVNLRKLDKGRYELFLSDNLFDTIYQSSKNATKLYMQIGCPIRSFIAILLAWSTNRAILLKSVDFGQLENSSITVYELGDLFH